jgi:hypothetical protein
MLTCSVYVTYVLTCVCLLWAHLVGHLYDSTLFSLAEALSVGVSEGSPWKKPNVGFHRSSCCLKISNHPLFPRRNSHQSFHAAL